MLARFIFISLTYEILTAFTLTIRSISFSILDMPLIPIQIRATIKTSSRPNPKDNRLLRFMFLNIVPLLFCTFDNSELPPRETLIGSSIITHIGNSSTDFNKSC
ncbi:hypothetical protein OR1_03937 [Geobacter sp. OR-1]|nr:hypothetical protein OR1_03937 [Geobacter sp. OR-1]